jgi:hypothetical protein
MPVSLRWFTLLWALYTVFAPPGLPSCWLERSACEVHPHPDGHPERAHSHEYLLDDMQAVGAALPARLIPAGLLIQLLQHVTVTVDLDGPGFSPRTWEPLFDPPPPR